MVADGAGILCGRENNDLGLTNLAETLIDFVGFLDAVTN